MTHSEKIDYIEAEAVKRGCRAVREENLSAHTSVKVGGSCDIMIFAPDSETAARMYFECCNIGLYAMVLGNGSNCLYSDDGFRGAVITLSPKSWSLSDDGEIITASAGAPLFAVCAYALEHSLTGLEFAYGIPGTVGGAVYMNAGAYGGDMKGVIYSVTAMNCSGEIVEFCPEELDLGYRTSRFETSGEIIISASFKLNKGEKSAISAKMSELLARRKLRQPLEYPSFGSAFKRPEGTYAGLVIEESGLKGYQLGGAQISPKHANFIINRGGATSRDISDLIELTQKKVKEKTGYDLEPEVRLIPSDK